MGIQTGWRRSAQGTKFSQGNKGGWEALEADNDQPKGTAVYDA